MPRGSVEWFDAKEGFGLIRQDQTGEELFVHESAVVSETALPLKPKQVVYFEILDGDHGRQAIDVRLAAWTAATANEDHP